MFQIFFLNTLKSVSFKNCYLAYSKQNTEKKKSYTISIVLRNVSNESFKNIECEYAIWDFYWSFDCYKLNADQDILLPGLNYFVTVISNNLFVTGFIIEIYNNISTCVS